MDISSVVGLGRRRDPATAPAVAQRPHSDAFALSPAESSPSVGFGF